MRRTGTTQTATEDANREDYIKVMCRRVLKNVATLELAWGPCCTGDMSRACVPTQTEPEESTKHDDKCDLNKPQWLTGDLAVIVHVRRTSTAQTAVKDANQEDQK